MTLQSHTHTGLTPRSYIYLFFPSFKFALFGMHNSTIIQLNAGTGCISGLAVKDLSTTMSDLELFRKFFTASTMDLCNPRISRLPGDQVMLSQ